MKVELLSKTNEFVKVMYTGAKTCVSAKTPDKIFQCYPSDEKMLKYVTSVLEMGHDSIARHVMFTFSISGVSRALSHQLVRHGVGTAFSQQSQRYVSQDDKVDEDWFVFPDIARRTEEDTDTFNGCLAEIDDYYDALKNDLGWKAEDARAVLPNATKTNLVVSFSYVALTNFLEKRMCSRAQREIRELAQHIKEACSDALPSIERKMIDRLGSFCYNYGYCPEGKYGCGKAPTLKTLLDCYRKSKK